MTLIRNISRHRLYAAGEPVGDSATRCDGCRLLLGGGGSGGGGSAYYGELNRLYQEQANSAALLRGVAEKNLPAATDAYMSEVNQVTAPGYADRQAAMAGADMASANAMERAATNRELTSMGVNPNDARFVGANRATEVNNAARMAAGKNIARNDANKYQLAVAQDAVGTFTGQSNSAAQQAAGASSGLSSLYNSKNAADQAQASQTANNVGSAVGGAMALGSIIGKWKDGGKVSRAKRPAGLGLLVERHMLGGMAGSQQKTQQGFFSMPTPTPPQSPQRPQQQADPVGSAVQTYGTVKNMADAYDKIKMGVPRQQSPAPVTEASPTPVAQAGTEKAAEASAEKATEAAAEKGAEAAANTAADTAGTAAADAAGTAAADATGTAATEALATQVGDAALTTATTEAGAAAGTAAAAEGATAAGSAMASGLGTAATAIGTAMPWIGAAMAVGSLLELWSDGGKAGTQQKDGVDVRGKGGKVPGEWSGNRDTVPALLVEGEGILNSEATKLLGDKGLAALNKKGLDLRRKGETPKTIKTVGLSVLLN